MQQHPAPLSAGEAMHLHYYCRHLPTGNVYPRLSYFVNRHAFAFCLNSWNRSDTWFYAETESEVNMPREGALMARGIAQHMWANLPKDSLNLIKLEHKHEGRLLFSIDARHCGFLRAGQPVLTGGAEVCVMLRPALYSNSIAEGWRVYKLAAGWDEGAFKVAVIKAYGWAIAGLERLEAAEKLWLAVTSLQGREGFHEAVKAWEKLHGESRAYSKMSLEEINAWYARVEKWSQENPPRA
jgi:hypothetical protein